MGSNQKDTIFSFTPKNGPDPKFFLDETFYFEIEFEKLKSTYIEIVNKKIQIFSIYIQ